MTQPMRMSILAARKGIRTPGAFDPAAPRYELAQKHDFRIIDGNAGYEEEEEKRKRREKEKADKIAAGGRPRGHRARSSCEHSHVSLEQGEGRRAMWFDHGWMVWA